MVRTFELEPTPDGRVTLPWDGTDESGKPLDDGIYDVTATAIGLDGEPTSIGLFRAVPIDGVSFLDGLVTLVSGAQELPFEIVLEVREPA